MKITASETAVLVAGVKVAKSTYANSVAFLACPWMRGFNVGRDQRNPRRTGRIGSMSKTNIYILNQSVSTILTFPAVFRQ